MEKKQNLISKIISVLFHPLLMPTYALIIIFNSGTHYSYIPFEAKKLIYILVFLSTFVIPVSIIPFLINLKFVTDFEMMKGRERILPLFISALSFYFAYYLLKKISFNTITFIQLMLLASSILIFICLLISIKWKISAHLIGIGGLLGALLFYALFFVADLNSIIIVITIISGAVAYSRLQLQAHSPMQVYAGFFTGFSGMILVLYMGI